MNIQDLTSAESIFFITVLLCIVMVLSELLRYIVVRNKFIFVVLIFAIVIGILAKIFLHVITILVLLFIIAAIGVLLSIIL